MEGVNLRISSIGIVTEENWLNLLRDHYIEFSRIRVEYFIDRLFEKRVLNDIDKDEIRNCNSEHRKATYLLDVLSGKGFANFVTFLRIVENEYPHIFENVTKEQAVPTPGYLRRDRRTLCLEQMPEMLKKLQEMISTSNPLTGPLQRVRESIAVLKEEKADLEKDLSRYREEQKQFQYLDGLNKSLLKDIEQLKFKKDEAEGKYLECAREKEELRLQNRVLLTELHSTGEAFTKKRIPEGFEQFKDNVDEEEDESGKQVSEKLLQIQLDVLKGKYNDVNQEMEMLSHHLSHTRDELERTAKEFAKTQEALKNSEENCGHLKKRSEETWSQLDQLRQEKDQNFVMYKAASCDRDRLFSKLRDLQRQYDLTKKQLDKLKQDMRSSLNSDGTANVQEWLKYLDTTGSSSSGMSSCESANQHRDQDMDATNIYFGNSVCNDTDPTKDLTNLKIFPHSPSAVTGNLFSPSTQGPLHSPVAYSSGSSQTGSVQDFFVRCENDFQASGEEKSGIQYKAGDVLYVKNTAYEGKADLWYVQQVDVNTGQLLTEPHCQGIVKVDQKKRNRPIPGQCASIARRDAVRKLNKNHIFTPVVCETAGHHRPVIMFGLFSDRLPSLLASKYPDKFENWTQESSHQIELKTSMLPHKPLHVILPTHCTDHIIEHHPICIEVEAADSDNSSHYLKDLFGDENSPPVGPKCQEEVKVSSVTFSTFLLSSSVISNVSMLAEKLHEHINHLQESVIWIPPEEKSVSQPTSPF